MSALKRENLGKGLIKKGVTSKRSPEGGAAKGETRQPCRRKDGTPTKGQMGSVGIVEGGDWPEKSRGVKKS